MFPIADRSGRVIAFGGRALDATVPAKYLNSPETPLFHKGAVLYNHHRARKAAQEHGIVIAVEGYVDVIAMTAAGFPNVVAPLGTALTIDQCDLLWRMSPRADPVLRRRRGRAPRRPQGDRYRAAGPRTRKVAAVRLPAGRPGSRRSRSVGRKRCHRGRAGAGASSRRRLVDARNRGRGTGHAGAPRRARTQARRPRPGRSRTSPCGGTMARSCGRAFRPSPGRLSGGLPPVLDPHGPRRPFGTRSRFAQQPLRGYRGSAPAPLSGSFAASAHARTGAFSRSDVEILTLVMNHPGLLDRHAEDLAHLDIGHPELARFPRPDGRPPGGALRGPRLVQGRARRARRGANFGAESKTSPRDCRIGVSAPRLPNRTPS